MKVYMWMVAAALVVLGACVKDEQQLQIVKAGFVSYSIDDITVNVDLRDGEKLGLDFPGSQVIYDLFKPGTPQTAFNQNQMDSAVYVKVSNAGVNPLNLGIIFRKYWTTKYFKDGTTLSMKVYAPESLGNYSKIIPNPNNNQLSSSNQFNYITIELGRRTEPYFDHRCGVIKKRYFYTEYAVNDSVGYYTIDGDRCVSNVFSYKLII